MCPVVPARIDGRSFRYTSSHEAPRRLLEQARGLAEPPERVRHAQYIPHGPHYLEGREELLDHLVKLHGFDRDDLHIDPEPLVTKHAREHSKPMADPTGPVAQAAHFAG